MADCPYCGKELVDDEMYCWHCENAMEDKESYKNKPSKPIKERLDLLLQPIVNFFKKFKSK